MSSQVHKNCSPTFLPVVREFENHSQGPSCRCSSSQAVARRRGRLFSCQSRAARDGRPRGSVRVFNGELVFVFMYFVVLLLTPLGPAHFSIATYITGPIGHTFLVGLPIALSVRRFAS